MLLATMGGDMVAHRPVEQVTADDVVPADRRHVLDSLMQLYLHDFSEHASLNTSRGEVDEDGRFAYRRLDTYWSEPGRVPLLIRAGGRIAGFVLVNQWSALDRPLDHAIGEFFVLRKYRRARVGTRAAHLVFRHMPGRWEVAVASYNQGALAFWRSVAASLPREAEERAGDGQCWAGTVLCFDTGSITE
jgi:predicted acetyltransferase